MRVVFFFKQKTAYEMRISDWSSDVCSSDLAQRRQVDPGFLEFGPLALVQRRRRGDHRDQLLAERRPHAPGARGLTDVETLAPAQHAAAVGLAGIGIQVHHLALDGRSEEHTSELQSLMRISYAVFCLKKKKK